MFISNAFADSGAAAQPGLVEQLIFFAPILLVAIYLFYTQFKRAKEHKSMTEGLQRGDEIVTLGGQLGRVTKVHEQYIAIEIADNLEVLIQKVAVQGVLPKGTMKSIK